MIDYFALISSDNTKWTPQQLLQESVELMESGRLEATSALLLLWEVEGEGKVLSYTVSNMTRLEALGTLAIASDLLRRKMPE